MADANWMSYVGLAAGLIGAATGISGAIVSYKSYLKVDHIKALDMRLELKRAVADFQALLLATSNLMTSAKGSNAAAMAASGLSRSGIRDAWVIEFDRDHAALQNFRSTKFNQVDYAVLTQLDLENDLVEIYRLQIDLKRIYDKYAASMSADRERSIHARNVMTRPYLGPGQ
jgi:hypothetical protein